MYTQTHTILFFREMNYLSVKTKTSVNEVCHLTAVPCFISEESDGNKAFKTSTLHLLVIELSAPAILAQWD